MGNIVPAGNPSARRRRPLSKLRHTGRGKRENKEASLPGGERAQRYSDYFGLRDRPADDLDELYTEEGRSNTFMEALKAVSPAPVYFVDIPGGKNGCCGHAENVVYLSRLISFGN